MKGAKPAGPTEKDRSQALPSRTLGVEVMIPGTIDQDTGPGTFRPAVILVLRTMAFGRFTYRLFVFFLCRRLVVIRWFVVLGG